MGIQDWLEKRKTAKQKKEIDRKERKAKERLSEMDERIKHLEDMFQETSKTSSIDPRHYVLRKLGEYEESSTTGRVSMMEDNMVRNQAKKILSEYEKQNQEQEKMEGEIARTKAEELSPELLQENGFTIEDYNVMKKCEELLISAENEGYVDTKKIENISNLLKSLIVNNPKFFLGIRDRNVGESLKLGNPIEKMIAEMMIKLDRDVKENAKRNKGEFIQNVGNGYKKSLQVKVDSNGALEKAKEEEKRNEYIRKYPYVKTLEEIMEYLRTRKFYGTTEESVLAQYKIANGFLEIEKMSDEWFEVGLREIYKSGLDDGEMRSDHNGLVIGALKGLHGLGIINLRNNLSELDFLKERYFKPKPERKRVRGLKSRETGRIISTEEQIALLFKEAEESKARRTAPPITELPAEYKKYIHEGNFIR